MQSVLAVIDLDIIRNNAKKIARVARRPLYAVVKDDAYGHGAAEVAHALEGTVAGFAVSLVDEGAALRAAGITKEILVLTPPLSKEEVFRISAYRLTASLNSFHTLHLLAGEGCGAHIVVNTGMNRYGVRPVRVASLCRAAAREGIAVTGVYSHLYAAQDSGARNAQTERFAVAQACVKQFFPHATAHLSATGGTLAGDSFDAVRVGIALYGYLPEGFCGVGVRPAMKVYATVAECRAPFGEGAGYQRAEEHYRRLHTLRVGYGDGFFRSGGLGVGKLCMDACIREGDARVGRRSLILDDAEKYAKEHGTTAYEVLVNVGRKAQKKYRGSSIVLCQT